MPVESRILPTELKWKDIKEKIKYLSENGEHTTVEIDRIELLAELGRRIGFKEGRASAIDEILYVIRGVAGPELDPETADEKKKGTKT